MPSKPHLCSSCTCKSTWKNPLAYLNLISSKAGAFTRTHKEEEQSLPRRQIENTSSALDGQTHSLIYTCLSTQQVIKAVNPVYVDNREELVSRLGTGQYQLRSVRNIASSSQQITPKKKNKSEKSPKNGWRGMRELHWGRRSN